MTTLKASIIGKQYSLPISVCKKQQTYRMGVQKFTEEEPNKNIYSYMQYNSG